MPGARNIIQKWGLPGLRVLQCQYISQHRVNQSRLLILPPASQSGVQDPAKIQGKYRFPQSLTLAWQLQFYWQQILSAFPLEVTGSVHVIFEKVPANILTAVTAGCLLFFQITWCLSHKDSGRVSAHLGLSGACLTLLYLDLWWIVYWSDTEKNPPLFIFLDTKPPFISAMSVRNILKANQVSKCIFGRIQVKPNG